MDENRCAIRWDVSLPVRYLEVSRQTEGTCKTQDLSTLGARLAMVEKHNPGDQLKMMIDIPGSSKGVVCVEADVIWQKKSILLYEGCNYLTGVVFRRIRDYYKKDILDYINKNYPEQFRAHWWNGL